MILFKLFLSFLKIGAFSFGGGYGMLAFMIDESISNNWLTLDEITNFIAVAESLPGPIAVDMATFIGSSQGGFVGALLSVMAVISTSFVIMLLIAKFFKKALNCTWIRKTINHIQPIVVGIILATATSFFMAKIFNISNIHSAFIFNWKGMVIFYILIIMSLLLKIWKKKLSPIIFIILSGILGVLFF